MVQQTSRSRGTLQGFEALFKFYTYQWELKNRTKYFVKFQMFAYMYIEDILICA